MSFAEAVSCEQSASAIAAQQSPTNVFFTGGCMKPNLSDRFRLVEKFLRDSQGDYPSARLADAATNLRPYASYL